MRRCYLYNVAISWKEDNYESKITLDSSGSPFEIKVINYNYKA